MKKTIALTVLGLLIVVAALVGVKALQIKTLIDAGKTAVLPPVSVSSYDVKADEWGNTLASIGSLEAAKGLIITADLSGRISKINFDAGSQVKAGDLLVEQDTSAEKAQLRSVQASAALAKNNLSRINELYRKKVASKAEFDNAQSAYRSAIANADNIRATIEKKSIRAPFDGSLGIRLVNLGQTINTGESVVSLQATNQMFVNFFLPQQLLSKVKPGLTVNVTSDAVPGEVFSGKINAIDPSINVSTRSIKIQALLGNPEGTLLTGMFVSLEVLLPDAKSVLLIPITAIQYATFGDSVFIIEEKKIEKKKVESIKGEEKTGVVATTVDTPNDKLKVEPPQKQLVARQQFVKLGEARGDFVSIDKGLEVGQTVASAGVFKLRNGSGVVINNSIVPEYSLEPLVENK
jgi:membrane fusion protein (multidrug efflux system)